MYERYIAAADSLKCRIRCLRHGLLSERKLKPWSREAIPDALKAALSCDDTQVSKRMGQVAKMVAPRRPCECYSPPNGSAAAAFGHQQQRFAERLWVYGASLCVLAAFERAVGVTTVAAVHEWLKGQVAEQGRGFTNSLLSDLRTIHALVEKKPLPHAVADLREWAFCPYGAGGRILHDEAAGQQNLHKTSQRHKTKDNPLFCTTVLPLNCGPRASIHAPWCARGSCNQTLGTKEDEAPQQTSLEPDIADIVAPTMVDWMEDLRTQSMSTSGCVTTGHS